MEKIPIINFFKRKYGGELLIDLNDIDYIKPTFVKCPVHRYSFYSLVLVTAGSEQIGINDASALAERATLISGIPGDVWRWNSATQLKGYVLVFEEAFVTSFFNDRLFLQRFAYLQRARRTPFYKLDEKLFRRVCSVMEQIEHEIHGDATNLRCTSLPQIDQHVLRAMLYEVLVLMNRAEGVNTADGRETALDRYVEPFVAMVECDFAEQRNIQSYADRLFITPNYLNKIVRQALGVSAKNYIHSKVVQEIKNQLDYTTLSVTEIAERLNFESASYLVRYFRKQTGTTPLQYRNR